MSDQSLIETAKAPIVACDLQMAGRSPSVAAAAGGCRRSLIGDGRSALTLSGDVT